jgi:hypothetical protein
MKILPVGAECFHADGQTDRIDMTKLRVGYHNVVKAPKKFCFTHILVSRALNQLHHMLGLER